MILTVILTGSAIILTQLALAIFAWRRLQREKQQAIATIRSYFESPDPETPSEFAKLIDAGAQVLSSRLVASLKGTFMGVQSGAKRGEDALQADFLGDAVSMQNPIAGAILNAFPAVKRRLGKNPELIPTAMAMLSKILPGGSAQGGNGKSDMADRISKLGGL